VIDDDAPTPRAFAADPDLLVRRPEPPGGRPDRPSPPPDSSRPGPESQEPPRPERPPAHDGGQDAAAIHAIEGVLGARLADRRRAGARPGPDDQDAHAADQQPAAARAAGPSRPTGPPAAGSSAIRPGASQPWAHVAGPADRTSFFAEQARHRRATWRLSLATAAAVILAGLPLSLVVTPLVYLAIILFTKAMSVVVPLSPAVPQLFRAVARSIGSLMDVVEASDKGPIPLAMVGPAAVGVVMLLLPGVLIMLAVWLLLRRLFSGAGVGGLVIGLGARAPQPDDLEERQLLNVVEEMAIAAGLPPPRVMLLDGQIANAAVVGSCPEDAVVVVSRRLLDEMNRDETQGILAHQIASIGNGDLGIALSMVTVFRTWGLVNTLLDAPISSSARATLWRLLGVLRGRTTDDAALRAAEAARLLGSRVSTVEWEDVNMVLGTDEEKARAPGGIVGLLLKIRVFALFPIWAASGLAKTALLVLVMALLSPMLAWTWRTRRYLADATAVQLTRNPDGIAHGLMSLLARGGGIRGGAWADHLFVVGGGVTDRARAQKEDLEALQAELEQESAGKSGAEKVAARLRAGNRYRQRLQAEADNTDGGDQDQSEIGQMGWLSVHPTLQSRLKRLQAMGAHVSAEALDDGGAGKKMWLSLLIFSPFLALVVFLMGVVVVLATGLVIVFMMIPMALVYAVFEWLF